ncbi:MAG: type II toxin-antitoxin system RelE/ParE family toxin [Candidatus Pacebacteria bacterium]|nr:type II toxin-antitoxin system RelE/ParE family toxin [Candidatus Paceibacterota bacterium]
MARLKLLPEAEKDEEAIISDSLIHWGLNSAIKYQNLLQKAYEQLSDNPLLVTSRLIDKKNNTRSLPLWLVPQPDLAMRVKNPPHILFYQINSPDQVTIVRILHRQMNHRRYLGAETP